MATGPLYRTLGAPERLPALRARASRAARRHREADGDARDAAPRHCPRLSALLLGVQGDEYLVRADALRARPQIPRRGTGADARRPDRLHGHPRVPACDATRPRRTRLSADGVRGAAARPPAARSRDRTLDDSALGDV